MENELGQSFPSTSMPVLKYSMTANSMVKENVRGAYASQIYGTQSDRLVEKGSFLPSNVVGKYFRWNKVSGWLQEQLNVNRVDDNCHCYVCMKTSALICLYFLSVCMWWCLVEDAWYRNKVAVHS